MRFLMLSALYICSTFSQISLASITPGSFKMYTEVNKTPNRSCDIYTTLEITESGSAILENHLSGTCEIYVAKKRRVYSNLMQNDSTCSNIYTSSRTLESGELVTLRIEDNRENPCERPISAIVVASETQGDNGSTRTFYSHKETTEVKHNKFVCGNVGGVDEWTIYIDLNKKIAGFFDNDNTAVVPLKKMLVLESFPPQYTYTFEGQDSGGGSNEVLRVDFNKTLLEGSVTFDALGPDPSTKSAEDGCVADNSIDFDLD